MSLPEGAGLLRRSDTGRRMPDADNRAMPNLPIIGYSGGEPVVLSLRSAASLLALHPNTVRAQVRRGIIPGVKIGRHWRFLEADLVAWIRSAYPEAARMQLSALEREAIWHSTDVQESIT